MVFVMVRTKGVCLEVMLDKLMVLIMVALTENSKAEMMENSSALSLVDLMAAKKVQWLENRLVERKVILLVVLMDLRKEHYLDDSKVELLVLGLVQMLDTR